MKRSLLMRVAGATGVAAVTLAGCGSNNSGGSGAGAGGSSTACASGTVTGQGSTFQQTIEQQWIADFTQACSGAQITYTGVGSGAGIEQFGAGTTDYAGSDVVMDSTEQAAADKACGSPAIHIPITAGGVAVIYNLQGVDSLKLSAPTLAKIFAGDVTTWDDPAIKADNPGVTLPGTAITVFHRADESGTTKVFTAFLDSVASADWKYGSDKAIDWPTGQGATGSDGVVAGVKQTDGAITYAEVSYAKQNSLPTAEVKGATGDYQPISADTVSQSLASGFSVTGSGADLAGALDFTKMTGYPISTVSYVIACSKYQDSAKGALVKAFLTYAAGDGQSTADQLGFAPLPTELDTKAKASIDSIS